MKKKTKNIGSLFYNYILFLKNQPKGFVYNEQKNTPNQSIQTIMPNNKTKLLTELKEKYKACMQCPLASLGRTQVVFGVGNVNAKLFFIGEGPGRDEDLQGAPFVGRAGKLLTKIIEAMEMTRDQVYISNVVKCRPPENRNPLPIEMNSCMPRMLAQEIEIVNPTIICTLGSIATQALLGSDTKISAVRGSFQTYKGYVVLPTYHPAYLLRNPSEKRTVWEDMKKIIQFLSQEKSQ